MCVGLKGVCLQWLVAMSRLATKGGSLMFVVEPVGWARGGHTTDEDISYAWKVTSSFGSQRIRFRSVCPSVLLALTNRQGNSQKTMSAVASTTTPPILGDVVPPPAKKIRTTMAETAEEVSDESAFDVLRLE
jgi:hypothetical protein